ncbi:MULTISPECIES: hypothetical protein [unclassified Anabaena]|uniref:hypothetical protein n=1 Tax=unclassified Anabaena TaxID=2619674 RepID=UPI00168A0A74|nr:hypothetical protein [Anabaena sp. UHCC 0399]MBD2364015.1 hypothetical protein [Anabaena minutissima FACHB-250]MEA5565286.1 hypothetical protein [Anabaena sp. UHCC 0399]
MTYRKWLLHKLLISCVLSLFSVTQAASAGYQPPDDQKPPKDSSDSSGVRLLKVESRE